MTGVQAPEVERPGAIPAPMTVMPVMRWGRDAELFRQRTLIIAVGFLAAAVAAALVLAVAVTLP